MHAFYSNNHYIQFLEKIDVQFISHMMIKTRIEAIDKLSIKALPETRKFMQSVFLENSLTTHFQIQIHTEFLKFFLKALQTTDNDFEKLTNESVAKVSFVFWYSVYYGFRLLMCTKSCPRK